MNCEMFGKSINEFKSHPILYNRLIERHLKENKDCSCKLEMIKNEQKLIC